MAEPPANWDQQDDDQSTVSSAANKLSALNVNATEFVPNFGGGFSFTPKSPAAPQTTAPKTPPSTPVVPRATIEDEKKPEPEPTIKPMEVNNQPVTTAEEREFDDLPDEDMESKISDSKNFSHCWT